ncbi:MAG: glucose ABC transporter permease GlcU [Pyrobaculum sp.]|uniref:Carbohydrate ABC transporter membrane protein 2, CUT1 family n=5 Tax=Thermoproteaceae TaxID=2267 RepID=A4WNB7_PYRAR|nr:glucose ABC transporter permease GlcU [Pyrobaculum arsenaticum]ABP51884.1 carbohydrate ABC transporter membrane protein 2, CUT1 family [Pyrobaculum arsenaticum DSM 13514]NYR16203.1 carbohydrate ABC transporter permease [Pyrobaculum arsenaticum]
MDKMRLLPHLIIAGIGALWALPLYVLTIGALKPLSEVLTTPVYVPSTNIDLTTLFRVAGELAPVLLNTALVVIPTALGAAFIGSLGAYALWRATTKLKDVLLVVVAVATYLPYQSAVVPLARFMTERGLFDTLYGIALGLLIFFIPFATLMMLIFITAIPRSVVEAAEIDGAGEMLIFAKAVLPLLGPAFTSVATYLTISGWNNFFIPLALSRTYNNHITLKVFSYVGQSGNLYNEMFSAALIASLLPLLLFIALGRYFIRGLLVLGSGGK